MNSRADHLSLAWSWSAGCASAAWKDSCRVHGCITFRRSAESRLCFGCGGCRWRDGVSGSSCLPGIGVAIAIFRAAFLLDCVPHQKMREILKF
jgi:hypothetical protein